MSKLRRIRYRKPNRLATGTFWNIQISDVWSFLSRIETPTSSHHNESNRDEELSKDWVTFEDEDKEYKKVDQWETFSEEEIPQSTKKWETFEDEPQNRNSKNLQLEMSFGKDQDAVDKPTTAAISGYQFLKLFFKLHTQLIVILKGAHTFVQWYTSEQ